MKISKDFEFAAAHRLTLPYDSPCARVHGHNYKLKVTVAGYLNDAGMIMDFKKLKAIVNEEIISALDHQDLTDFFSKDPDKEHVNATVEIMSKWIYERLERRMGNIHSVQLWETSDSMAEYP